ncbi:sensor histidine kinase [Campylobacter concisus]|uniref:sensor histidine kinase n=1 Tax=Campylobacter concisus TaxID=199 RepID=UPI000CD85499|nr:HAMP domain-containing sensor histidine kinase [Campylobacter concisus]
MNEHDIQAGLKSLIEQTYLIENEYKNLTSSYANLQNFIKDIVEILPNAIWVLDENDKIFLQNSEAVRLGKIFKEIPKKEGEINIDGQIYLFKTSSKDNKLIISATNITVEKRTERLASMGQVAAHLAHEIRNPVGSISLLASTLLKRVDESIQPIVNQIQKATWRVERIIKATLLFTKGLNINAQIFDFLQLKKECEEAINFYDYSKDIKFSLEFPDGKYMGDLDLLAIVFQNILFNAIDAIEESDDDEGEIILSYEKTPSEHKFIVYDSGEPIKDKAIVFEPFKSSKLKGNGLGLHLCLQIVEAHKGSIEITLNPKTFCINLPIKEKE